MFTIDSGGSYTIEQLMYYHTTEFLKPGATSERSWWFAWRNGRDSIVKYLVAKDKEDLDEMIEQGN